MSHPKRPARRRSERQHPILTAWARHARRLRPLLTSGLPTADVLDALHAVFLLQPQGHCAPGIKPKDWARILRDGLDSPTIDPWFRAGPKNPDRVIFKGGTLKIQTIVKGFEIPDAARRTLTVNAARRTFTVSGAGNPANNGTFAIVEDEKT